MALSTGSKRTSGLRMTESRCIRLLEDVLFTHRKLVLAVFLLITAALLLSALRLRVDAGFTKSLPLKHEYIKTFLEYRAEFGGANRILVALIARDGNMFTPEFFSTLKDVTDEVFFIPGIDRAQVRSLF